MRKNRGQGQGGAAPGLLSHRNPCTADKASANDPAEDG